MGAFFKTRRHISVLFLNTVFGDKYQLVNYRSYLYLKKKFMFVGDDWPNCKHKLCSNLQMFY